MNKTDQEFIKSFALIIGGLMALTLVLAVAARLVYAGHLPEPSAVRAAQASTRIAPVAAVYAGSTGQAAMQAAQAAAAVAAQATVAYEGTLQGEVIYGKLCTACHGTGAAGAPMLLKSLWAPRVAQGFDTLASHAVVGYQGSAGMMPARGGNPSLSDEQVKATVQRMIDHLK